MSRVVKYLRYMLTLQAPAVITTLSGDPNSSATQPFIPGGMLRGILAGELLDKGISADSSDFSRLILDGDVRFLHAYPSRGSVRSLPAPIPWKKVKEKANKPPYDAYDLTAYTGMINAETVFVPEDNGEISVDPAEMWPMESLQQVEFPFIEFSGITRALKVHTDTRLHQQRDRVKGRSWKTPRPNHTEKIYGALFTYEYLEQDQSFHGLIQVMANSEGEATEVTELVSKTLNQRPIFIGRSRRAGYGGAAEIHFGSIEDHEANWRDIQHNDVQTNSLFRAYLLSACIARDPHTGQFDPCALPGLLVRCLGGDAVVSVERILWDFETMGGFNRKWQLQVPQALAVKAGSMLVLKSKQDILATKLREIEHDGVGERRMEGFGRLVFLKGEPSRQVSISFDNREEPTYRQPDGPVPEAVSFLQQRILDAAFSRVLLRQVRELVSNTKNIPTGSLLGRLRIPLRSSNPKVGLQTLQQWLDDRDSNRRTALKEEAQKKLRECRLANGITLQNWLIQHVTTKAAIEAATNEVAVQRKYRLDADGCLARSIAEARGAHYTVRLIDAVLAALARKARRREREGSR